MRWQTIVISVTYNKACFVQFPSAHVQLVSVSLSAQNECLTKFILVNRTFPLLITACQSFCNLSRVTLLFAKHSVRFIQCLSPSVTDTNALLINLLQQVNNLYESYLEQIIHLQIIWLMYLLKVCLIRETNVCWTLDELTKCL